MRYALLLALVVACAASPSSGPDPSQEGPNPSQDSGPDPMQGPGGGGGEIDGTYLDVHYGRCSGGVGGAIRCAGSPCDGLAEAACGTAACVSAYSDDGAGAQQFRACFPVDARSTATGDCSSLTVEACVTRSDCSPVYVGLVFGSFVRCEVDPAGV